MVHLKEDTLQTATEDIHLTEEDTHLTVEDIHHHVDHLQDKRDILNLHHQERITTTEVKE
jgi:hypothetical protein